MPTVEIGNVEVASESTSKNGGQINSINGAAD